MSDVFKILQNQDVVDDFDFHFAKLITRIEKNISEAENLNILQLGAALISSQTRHGHICFTEESIEDLKTNEELKGVVPSWNQLKKTITESSSCSDGKRKTPFIFDGKRFYLFRYWQYENMLAKKIVEISKTKCRYSEKLDELSNQLTQLFEGEKGENSQFEAALTAVSNRFSVITGGPGTGKTTVIAKILAAIYSVFPDETVLLAAPTGKAASRMNEALKNALKNSKGLINEEVKSKIQELSGSSIHRLLGWTSWSGGFAHNEKKPLDAGIVIVDEASMISLSLMLSLVNAVRKGSSLVLLGDKDQLASVEAGNVLGDICKAANEKAFENKNVATLTKSYRFKENKALGELASVINESSDASDMLKVFEKHHNGSTRYLNKKMSEAKQFVKEVIVENYSPLFESNNVASAIDALEKFRIFCGSKIGVGGVSHINQLAESIFIEKGFMKSGKEVWYHGRPIMVTQNNPNLELFNGDCGVVFEQNGEKRGYFPASDGSIKSFPVSTLPVVETVYAMTIHKSQGSEYNSVIAIFPEVKMAVLSKELLYTAATRSKEKLTLIGQWEIIEAAFKKPVLRNSGLSDALIFFSNSDS
ncbi:MAG: exodeoxyribonuclease V subunit alpha [bacterium]